MGIYRELTVNPLTGEPLEESWPLPAGRLARNVNPYEGLPWEFQAPVGTPEWARMGSIPARAITHVPLQLARDIGGAVMLPGDVLTGQVDPASPEGFARTLGAATMLAGGPVAQPKPGSALATGWGGKVQPEGKMALAEKPALEPKPATDEHLAALEKELKELLGETAVAAPKKQEPFTGELQYHPVTETAGLKAAPVPVQEAALELLSALKTYPDKYKKPEDYFNKMKDEGFLDAKDIPHFQEALTHLNDYAAKHGDFAFAKIPPKMKYTVAEKPKEQKPFVGDVKFHPAFQKAYESLETMPTVIIKQTLTEMQKGKSVDDAFDLAKGIAFGVQKWFAPAKAFLANYIKEHGEFNFPAAQAGHSTSPTVPPSSPMSKAPPFAVHPWDIRPPQVMRKTFEEAVTPVDFRSLMNAAKEAKAWNVLTNPALREGELGERMRRAEAQGYNVALPMFKGMNAKKWVLPEEETGNVLWPRDPMLGGFSSPAPGKGKPSEHMLFHADTPRVSNEYASLWGDMVQGGRNMLLYGRAEQPYQVYWPEIAQSPNYANSVLHDLINYVLSKRGDMLAVHGINDLGGLHTQYGFALPEQLRSVTAEFDPAFLGTPNIALTQGNPLMVQGAPERRKRSKK